MFAAVKMNSSLGVTIVEMLTGERPLAGAKIQGFNFELNSLLTQMVSLNLQERPGMKDVKRSLLRNYQLEIKKSQNRLQLGAKLFVLGVHL